MATTTITNRCREYWLKGVLDAENDTLKLALYNNSGHGANTNAYTTTAEVSGSGYTAKGNTLSGVSVTTDTSNNVSYVDFSDSQWTSSTITATDCMIFADNIASPAADPAMYIGDFNGSKSSSSGTFTVQFPTASATTAIIRIA